MGRNPLGANAWPLPDNTDARAVLLVHENFHRIEGDLHLQGGMDSNAHLDTEQGRTLLQLEWRALKAALRSTGNERKRAIGDALIFRNERRRLFKTAAAEENSLERYEGLAEYTGVTLAGADASARRALAIADIDAGPLKKSFVRSFAYASGPAYGVLLDEAGAKTWRKEMPKSGDLGILLAQATGVSPSDSAGKRAKIYDGESLAESERERAVRAEKLAQTFVLELSLEETRILRSQSVIIEPGAHARYGAFAFTEQGVAMLSSVLKSKRAMAVNVEIMRTFVRLREVLATHTELAKKLAKLESKYDAQFKAVFDAIRELMMPPKKSVSKIGFRREPDES